MREFWDEVKAYLTPCNLAIMLLNIAVFIVQCIAGDEAFTSKLVLQWWSVFDNHEYYRLVSHFFLHGSVGHLFNNLLVLAFVGSKVELLVGKFKYLVNYMCSGVVAGLVSIVWDRWCFNNSFGAEGYISSLGASGAVFGMVGALLFIVIANRGHVACISTRQLFLFILLSIYAGVSDVGIDNAAHIGGAVFGFISATILYDRSGGYA